MSIEHEDFTMNMNAFQSAPRLRFSSDLLVFAFFAFLYLFTASGHIESIDGNVMFAVTQNIVRAGSLFPHSAYGPVLSLVAIPFYLVGLVATKALHFPGDYLSKAAVSFTNAFVTALTCVLVAAVARRVGAGRRAAYVFALVYGTCTLAWPYAKTFFSEPLTALWLLLAFWALLHVPTRILDEDQLYHAVGLDARVCPNSSAHYGRPVPWVIGAFAALGLALLTRETTLITLPLFVVYLVVRTHTRLDRWRLLRAAGVTIMVSLLAVGAVNVIRFGRIGATGYTGHLWTPNILFGLYGLLIGPYKGLILFVPLTSIAFLSWPRFYRRRAPEALLCGGIFLVYLAVHAAYIDWPGGGNWGPRFLVPALPFLFLALPFGWTRTPRWTAATLLLCAASLAVQLPAVYVSYARYYPVVGTYDDLTLMGLTTRDPLRSPIIVQWRSVPVVTTHLRDGLRDVPGARADLAQRQTAQPATTLPPTQVLRRSITVNVPDFWFVYLSLSGHLSRALRVGVGLLGIAVLVTAALIARMLHSMAAAPLATQKEVNQHGDNRYHTEQEDSARIAG